MKTNDEKWFGGRLMAFSGVDGHTDFENGLIFRTSFEFMGLHVKFPGDMSIFFEDQTIKPFSFAGDWFEYGSVCGAFIDSHHFIIRGKCRCSTVSDKLKYIYAHGKTLIGVADFFNEQHIENDIDKIIEERKAWERLINSKMEHRGNAFAGALSLIKTQICSPHGVIKHRWTTPDRWPHRKMWLWDSVFHAAGLRHIDVQLAMDALDAVLDAQQDDGFIPICTPHFGDKMTQPPLLAFGYKLVNTYANDKNWIAEAYPKLKKYIDWDLKNRRTKECALLEWGMEPGRKGCNESGMDNSPRFDSGNRLYAVDFSSMLALECEAMAEFATALNSCDVTSWRNIHQVLCKEINRWLWNDEEYFYFDYDVKNHIMSDVMASSGFMPLICGACDRNQALRLAEHLSNSTTFGTAMPVPSIAADSTACYSKDMWRGPAWINLNWLIAYGFERYGMNEQSEYIKGKSISKIEQTFNKYGTFFEFFDDREEVEPPLLLRKGKNECNRNPFHQVIFDYGWTAALYVDMMCCIKSET